MVDRLPSGVEIKGEFTPEFAEILTHGALALVARLHRSFEYRRQEMLAQREQIAKQFDLGLRPDFLKYTASIREGDWKIGKLPKDLQCR
ncbi:MAG: malate synthase A, partial [Burkholderiaceae bacterium]